MASHSDRLDVAPEPLFTHTPFDLTKSSLRLLRILSVSSSGVIECELSIHEFEHRYGLDHDAAGTKCSYDALSYEWGPDEPPFHWIRLNGRYFRVRHNLYSFLRVAYSRLRLNPDLTGLLWIDAICIDQQNLLERGHQVKQMGRIYNSASTVLVWLGPDVDKHLGFSAIHDLAQWTKGAATSMPPELLIQVTSEVYPAFKAVCERSYWTRMWIYQEIFCAKKALLIDESATCPWEPIKRMMRTYQPQFQDVIHFPALKVVTYLAKEYSRATMCDLVHAFGDGKCSDVRDRVYAILALLPSKHLFPVQYSITEVELLWKLMLASYIMLPPSDTFVSPARMQYAGKLAQIPSHHGFNCYRRAANAVDLFGLLAHVLGALHVSFSSLNEYLAQQADLGLKTLMCLEVEEWTETAFTKNQNRHSFSLMYTPASNHTRIVLQDVQPNFKEGDLHCSTCRITQKRTSSKRGPDGKNETLTYMAASPDLTYWTQPGPSLWLSVRAVMFFARAVHTIHHLSQDKLDEIGAHDGAVTMSLDKDGTRHIEVDLSSHLADIEF